MAAARKLRIVTRDDDEALARLQDGIEEATGLAVEPELQEIEHGALIVEVVLEEPSSYPVTPPAPALVTRALETSHLDVDVLSSWVEERSGGPARPLRMTDSAEPFSRPENRALDRAAVDDVATAVWHPPAPSGGRSGVWELAVPFRRADRSTCIALCERDGYSYRFSTEEVARFRDYLESAV
jgi:hypothetical protein